MVLFEYLIVSTKRGQAVLRKVLADVRGEGSWQLSHCPHSTAQCPHSSLSTVHGHIFPTGGQAGHLRSWRRAWGMNGRAKSCKIYGLEKSALL